MDGGTSFDPIAYWRSRHAAGGNSGAGAAGRADAFKGAFVNQFVRVNGIASVIDFGCGDGRQVAHFDVPDYCGVDISTVALERCRARMSGNPRRRFLSFDALPHSATAELGLSLDVLYDLTETSLYEAYLNRLFGCAERYILLYTSNPTPETCARETAPPHYSHRCVTDDVRRLFPDWRLLAHVPNPFCGDPRAVNEPGFADFFVYGFGRPSTLVPVADA